MMESVYSFMTDVGDICDAVECKSCKEREKIKVTAKMALSAIHRGDTVIAETGLVVGIEALGRLIAITEDSYLFGVRAYWLYVLANVRKVDQERQAVLRLALARANGMIN